MTNFAPLLLAVIPSSPYPSSESSWTSDPSVDPYSPSYGADYNEFNEIY